MSEYVVPDPCLQCGGSVHVSGDELACGQCGMPVRVQAQLAGELAADARQRAQSENESLRARSEALGRALGMVEDIKAMQGVEAPAEELKPELPAPADDVGAAPAEAAPTPAQPERPQRRRGRE